MTGRYTTSRKQTRTDQSNFSCTGKKQTNFREESFLICYPTRSLLHSQELPTCPCHEPDQSSQCPPPHFLKINFNITPPSTPGSSKCLLPSGLPTKILYLSLLFPTCTTCPAHLIILDLIIQISGEYTSQNKVFHYFVFPVTSSLVGPNISLSTLFPNTLSLCSSLTVGDQNKRKNYSSTYLDLYIFGQQTGTQKILHRIIASIP